MNDVIRRTLFFALLFMIYSAPPDQPSPVAAESLRPADVVRMSAATEQTPNEPSEILRITLTVQVAPGWHINSAKPAQEFLIPSTVSFESADRIFVRGIHYPPGIRRTLPVSDQPLDLYEGEVVITARVQPPTGGQRSTLTAVLRYQACDEEKCLPPAVVRAQVPPAFAATDRAPMSAPMPDPTPVSTRAIPAPAIAAIPILDTPPLPRSTGSFPPPAPANAVADLFSKRGPAAALLAIFIAGFALNLTPCVYPMIPLTIAYFGGTATGSPAFRAILYFMGMVMTYSLLGIAAGLTGGLFGGVLQHPAVLVGLSMLMLYLAGGMFGWFPFGLPQSVLNRAGAAGRVPLGAFGMGVTAGLVAAPCIGPIVVALLAYVSARQSAMEGMILFSVLSAGLGVPYLLLGFFSDQLHRLPRSGSWLGAVKWVFGFVLLMMGIYFLEPMMDDRLTGRLYAVILAAAAITSVSVSARQTMAVRLGGWILAAALLGCAYAVSAPRNAPDDTFWLQYDQSAFDQARSQGRPIILDFYAEWCVPCKKLDQRTFSDPRVRVALDGAARLKVDVTSYESPESLEIRRRHRVHGVPTTIVLDGTGVERLRFEDFFEPDEFLKQWSAVFPAARSAK